MMTISVATIPKIKPAKDQVKALLEACLAPSTSPEFCFLLACDNHREQEYWLIFAIRSDYYYYYYYH